MYIKDPFVKDFITFLQITCILCVCVYLNEKKKKQRFDMNDCFKHGKVLYADQP